MEQYIPKAAVVAEIESLISNGQVKLQESKESNDYENYVAWAEHIATCIKVLSLIDKLEVKEVDLRKELNDFIEEQKAWVKDDRVVEYNNGDSFNHIYDLESVARHFFELGLKTKAKNIWHDANKEEPKIGKAFATIDSDGVTCAEYHVFEGGLTFEQIKEMDNIVKWAYVEDLIPKD